MGLIWIVRWLAQVHEARRFRVKDEGRSTTTSSSIVIDMTAAVVPLGSPRSKCVAMIAAALGISKQKGREIGRAKEHDDANKEVLLFTKALGRSKEGWERQMMC